MSGRSRELLSLNKYMAITSTIAYKLIDNPALPDAVRATEVEVDMVSSDA